MRQIRLLKTAALVSGAALATTSELASAQSSITLYGVADVSVRYLTNSNAKNDGRLYMTNGAITNSRWGLRGSEDLGGGLKAIFDLESGINLQDGSTSDSQRIFNRNAYVGLSSQYGTVTFVPSEDAVVRSVGRHLRSAHGRQLRGEFMAAGRARRRTLCGQRLMLTGATYYDHMSNAAIGNGQLGSGNRYTFVALAEYALSKRTEVYGTVDFDKVSGAASVELPGKNNQTGVALGLRTIF